MKTRQWPVPPAPGGADDIGSRTRKAAMATAGALCRLRISDLERQIREAKTELSGCPQVNRREYLAGRVRTMERRIQRIRRKSEAAGWEAAFNEVPA